MQNENSELNKLAAEVLKKYNVKPEGITIIQGGSIKTLWKFKSDGIPFCLKRLKHTADKAEFSVNAQIYIKNNNGKVPEIIRNIDGKPITAYEGQLFVLYQWIQGSDLNFGIEEDLSAAVKGLAEFHKASKEYNPPNESKTSSKLGKWIDQYNSMRNKFEEWKAISKNNSSIPCYAEYLKYVDSMIEICNQAIEYQIQSDYKKLTEENSSSVVLCHQDYGKGNALSTDEGIFVIDLDGVTYDLPARDLRKIIGKISENKGKWEAENIHKVIEWYDSVNPMTTAEKKVLYIDLLFPHWFYGLVKNIFQNSKMLKASEIEKISRLELSKVKMLTEMIMR